MKYFDLFTTVQEKKRVFFHAKTLRLMKRSFLPSNVTITKISAKVSLQDLLNITVESILTITNICNETVTHLKLICKWGFDGSSEYLRTKVCRK